MALQRAGLPKADYCSTAGTSVCVCVSGPADPLLIVSLGLLGCTAGLRQQVQPPSLASKTPKPKLPPLNSQKALRGQEVLRNITITLGS